MASRISVEDWQTIAEVRGIINRRDGDLSYDPEFGEDARCKDVNPALFFPERGQSPKEGKNVCEGCPVWVDCLLYSMQHRGSTDWGTYGRLSPRARAELAIQLDITPTDIDPVREYWGTRGWGIGMLRAYRDRKLAR